LHCAWANWAQSGKKDAEGNLAGFQYSPNSEEVVQQKQRQLQQEQEAAAERTR